MTSFFLHCGLERLISTLALKRWNSSSHSDEMHIGTSEVLCPGVTCFSWVGEV